MSSNLTVDVAFEDAFRAEVTRVRLSPEFRNAPVLSKLLAFLAQETLAGRGDALKAYGVAVDGLGRSPDFDATMDSYPRVQIGRLRKALEAYYSHRPEQLVHCLHVPSGGYRLRLSARSTAYPFLQRQEPRAPAPQVFMSPTESREAASETAGSASPRRPGRRLAMVAAVALLAAAVALFWFQPWNAASARTTDSPHVLLKSAAGSAGGFGTLVNGHIADGLRRSWVMRLSVGQPPEPDTKLSYRIETQIASIDENSIDLFVRVIDVASGGVIWSADERLARDGDALQTALGPLIASIGSPFGVIARAERSRLLGDATPGYACMLLNGEYYRTRDPVLKSRVASCIVRDGQEPQLLPAIESARAIGVYGRAETLADRPAALRRARQMAANSLERYWDSADVLFANAALAFYAGDCGRGESFTDRAVAANPYQPTIVGSLGALTYQCDKAKSRTLLERARILEPEGPANFRIPLLLMAANGDSGLDVDQLDAEMQSSQRSSPAVTALGRALVAATKGDRNTARRNWDVLERLSPGDDVSVDETLRPYILSDQLRAIAVRQLQKGGISDR